MTSQAAFWDVRFITIGVVCNGRLHAQGDDTIRYSGARDRHAPLPL
jgi:hypothetical protein